MKLKSKGFTLIELVVVIVILGILAAVAAPKFIDLQSDAKTSALQGLKGALNSALATTHAKILVTGNDEKILNSGTTPKADEVIEGCTGCTFGFGYPAPDNTTLSFLVDGIGLNFEGDFVVAAFTSLGGDIYRTEITFEENVDPVSKALLTSNCYVRYTMSLVGTAEPTVEISPCE